MVKELFIDTTSLPIIFYMNHKVWISFFLEQLEMRTDKEKAAISELKKYIKKHKLTGWEAKLTGRGKKYAARTLYTKKVIELSTRWLEKESTTGSVITDAILHEIAHALTPGDGHGEKWRALHKALGGTGRLHTANKLAFKCQSCGKVTNSSKRIRVCPGCKNSFVFKKKS